VTGLSDSFQRPINYLRISVTDRCNLRCVYCMPSGGIKLMSHEDILTYEEICTIARAAAELGISKVRITGGEPLVRTELPELIQMLAGIDAIDDISLTTNGTLLADYAAELKRSGLRRVNISLDTLKPDRFKRITRGSSISDGWHVRFIEFMPVIGGDTVRFVPVSDMRKRLERLGKLEPYLPDVGNGPAKYFRFPHARGTIGFITPVSEHFCFLCNRLRLTADGKLRPCLLSDDEIDLKQPLRSGISLSGLKQLIEETVARKPKHHHLAEGYVPGDRSFSQVGG